MEGKLGGMLDGQSFPIRTLAGAAAILFFPGLLVAAWLRSGRARTSGGLPGAYEHLQQNPVSEAEMSQQPSSVRQRSRGLGA